MAANFLCTGFSCIVQAAIRYDIEYKTYDEYLFEFADYNV